MAYYKRHIDEKLHQWSDSPRCKPSPVSLWWCYLLFFLICQHIAIWGYTGHFIPSERFSSGLINELCQDRYGYMWIATDYGLNRYDGYRFVEYQHQPGDAAAIGSSNAVCFFCDRDGNLRLEQAARLLREGKVNVSQVAVIFLNQMVGPD